jgi:UDP-galactopyranose mutase
MSRFARNRRVFFVEEPIFDSTGPSLQTSICTKTGVCVVTPHLVSDANRNQELESLLKEFLRAKAITKPVVWYYTPMALEFFPRDVEAAAIVYDCMDELSMFKGAPSQLQMLEKFLIQRAHLVFTGGVSLFESKRRYHSRVYPFPSGVDLQHFAQARSMRGTDFNEHVGMARPRLGYAGVIDERINLELIDQVAARRPEWQIVMIGPTAKIQPESLPQRPNIHWLGMKDYTELPKYFAGWNAGIMPFALNDATKYISPTKTPEYLSAGLPVISTSVRDVVRPYGELGLAKIADTADEFIAAAEQVMNVDLCLKWRERVDEFLKGISWDSVWERMDQLIQGSVQESAGKSPVAMSQATAAKEREDREALPSFDIFSALASVARV